MLTNDGYIVWHWIGPLFTYFFPHPIDVFFSFQKQINEIFRIIENLTSILLLCFFFSLPFYNKCQIYIKKRKTISFCTNNRYRHHHYFDQYTICSSFFLFFPSTTKLIYCQEQWKAKSSIVLLFCIQITKFRYSRYFHRLMCSLIIF